MTRFSELCQFNGGCMGCCGHSFFSKDGVQEAIRQNTDEFDKFAPQTETQLMRFRERAPRMDLRNGVCRNLIEKDGQFFCPLHPSRNNGRDLRVGHCDIDHLCRTAIEFTQWSKERQEKFLEFIKRKKLDNLDYSLKIDNSSLLEEFESSK